MTWAIYHLNMVECRKLSQSSLDKVKWAKPQHRDYIPHGSLWRLSKESCRNKMKREETVSFRWSRPLSMMVYIWFWLSQAWSDDQVELTTTFHWGMLIMADLLKITPLATHYVYIILISMIGSVVLYTASALNKDSHVQYVDALFMSFSAMTGTGLNVVCFAFQIICTRTNRKLIFLFMIGRSFYAFVLPARNYIRFTPSRSRFSNIWSDLFLACIVFPISIER